VEEETRDQLPGIRCRCDRFKITLRRTTVTVDERVDSEAEAQRMGKNSILKDYLVK
jgi:hypothetical protein